MKTINIPIRRGIAAAFASAFFLGMAPVFGKQAFFAGFTPLATVSFRTTLAAIFLIILLAIFKRSYFYIYPAGLLGCGLAGIINGLGSIFYYLALERLTASVSQLIYSLYPVFVAIWTILDRHNPSRLTFLRIAVSIAGVVLLTASGKEQIDWLGVIFMLLASILYGMHLPINQRVLYDIPAQTVTLYTLLAMSAVVLPAYFIFDRSIPSGNFAWWPIIGLTTVTFLSRITLFIGVKHLGGMQTAILGLSELIVTIVISYMWLGDTLLPLQWLGAGLLGISILLIGFEKFPTDRHPSIRNGWLSWIRPPDIPPNFPWNSHE